MASRGTAVAGQPGFFDLEDRYAALSSAGDPLVRLGELVDLELFRPRLVRALRRSDRGKGGRPPYYPVLMFKVLILQSLYGLSDDATEFQIRDRLSFRRFLGLGLHDRVPDAKTIWLFRELLVRAKAVETLFDAFNAHLRDHGYLAMSGQIVDATIVAAPKQRNSDAEKDALKAGRIPEAWKDEPAKLRQKDRDARWTMKRGRVRRLEDGRPRGAEIMVPAFGYKNHISTDRRHGLIRRWTMTHAAAGDARLAGLDLRGVPPAWRIEVAWGRSLRGDRPRRRAIFAFAPVSSMKIRRRGSRSGWYPFSDEAFVFRSKRADRVKVLVWDRTGLVLVQKRLEVQR